MTASVSANIAIKPRVLIADDSRIVRATLIKHIESRFEFREALDGEEAWEKLLIDPEIRVVITDLTMPKLDGYGLLKRIRASKISRIRNIPVVVISGSDEQEERNRAKSFGATDLITKGIGTAQLLSRLDVLSDLAPEPEVRPEAIASAPSDPGSNAGLASSADFREQAQALRDGASGHHKNFILLSLYLGRQEDGQDVRGAAPDGELIRLVGRFLQQTVRQTDCLTQSGKAEFMLATSNIHADAARGFAQRLCAAIAGADWVKDKYPSLVVSCGVAILSECGSDLSTAASFDELADTATRRALAGLRHCRSGAVGAAEEAALREEEEAARNAKAAPEAVEPPPDLPTLLQWAREGRRDLVMLHVSRFPELQSLIDMLQK